MGIANNAVAAWFVYKVGDGKEELVKALDETHFADGDKFVFKFQKKSL